VQSVFIESFNRKLRDECLNRHMFLSLGKRARSSRRNDTTTTISGCIRTSAHATPREFADSNGGGRWPASGDGPSPERKAVCRSEGEAGCSHIFGLFKELHFTLRALMEIRAPSPGQLSGLEGLGTGQVRKAPVRPVCGELLIFDTAAHPICDRWALREIGLQIKPNLASRTSSFRPPERPGRAGSKRRLQSPAYSRSSLSNY
jgi:hypothetical protein